MPGHTNQATHGRVLRLKGEPAKVDEAIRQWTNQILPLLKKQDGFRGASLVGNRKTGEGLSVSYWDSETAMKTARERVRPQAQAMLDATGRTIVEEDECEVSVQERFEAPKSGVWVRVTSLQADPAKIAEGTTHYKTKVVPAIRALPGARAAILLVNPRTGKSFSATIWNTEADLRNSESAVSGPRQEAITQFGGKSPRVDVFEIFATEILTPAAVGAERR